jgi:membrane protease subunit HflK
MSTLQIEPREAAQIETPDIEQAARARRFGKIFGWVLALWLLSGVYIVSTDQQAVVTRFGRIVEQRVQPGIHYTLPWPIDKVYRLKVNQLRRAIVGGDVADSALGRLQTASSEFLSGDQNLLNMRVVAQYSVSEPADFVFTNYDVDQSVRAAVESALSYRLAHTTVDDILTTEKTAIQNDVLEHAQRELNDYRSGVTLASINIESASPPAEAADAFRSVAGARSDAIRFVNEAQGYSSDLIPRARGEAAKLLDEGRAYKEDKVNRAQGDAVHFDEVVAEYQKHPDVTSTRVYVEALEQILPRVRKTIVDPNSNLDLTLIGQEKPAQPAGGDQPK